MHPMTFTEFLEADDCKNLVEYMDSIQKIEKIPDVFFNILSEKLKAYFIIGGMPEAVNSWVNSKDMDKIDYIQGNILSAYESDFAKYTTNFEANKISIIFSSIPSQLSRKNKKFVYQVAKDGARAREYEDALNWLKDANILNKVYNVTKPCMPLISYNDISSFKIYLHDVGLLRKMTNLDSKIIMEKNKLFEEFKGAFTENFILQSLIEKKFNINYFTFENRYQIDFLMQYSNEIIPIEVKSGKCTNNTSLKMYNEKFSPKVRIRLSMNNLNCDDNLINIPLFLVEYLDKFVDIGLI